MTQAAEELAAPLLQCAPNFRDIGGYRNADGRTVRRGRIFRSQVIINPPQADLATLDRLGIRYVCDFRGTREGAMTAKTWPSPDGATPFRRHLDIGVDVRSGAERLLEVIVADPTARGVHNMMLLNYSLLPQAFAGRLNLMLDDLLADGLPAVIHCTAGKDRTGFVSALLLLTLGVPMDAVHQDYILTNRLIDMDRMMVNAAGYLKMVVGDDFEPGPEMLRVLSGTSPDYLESALATVDRDYGSVENYLTTAAGFDRAKQDRFRAAMLE